MHFGGLCLEGEQGLGEVRWKDGGWRCVAVGRYQVGVWEGDGQTMFDRGIKKKGLCVFLFIYLFIFYYYYLCGVG